MHGGRYHPQRWRRCAGTGAPTSPPATREPQH